MSANSNWHKMASTANVVRQKKLFCRQWYCDSCIFIDTDAKSL